ncbi:hypothetical protein GCK32_013081 [Trichostrongylus colubriformis]|uniref:Uncharacterized protein n=1 Tax=Trichostrongylus colubriformis TaxID=6319 RepID=A0AAN8IGB1_TRICO
MASQLSTKKRLLTTAVNKLENVVTKLQAEKLEELPIDPQALIEAVKENVSRLEEGIFAIDFARSKAEKELADYGALLDSLVEKEVHDYQTYSIKAESALSKAFLGLLIQARRQALVACASTTNTATVSNSNPVPIRTPQPKPLELPPLPIPTFGGNLWEWDNFWEIFNSNIHTQDIPERVKYDYLINALKDDHKKRQDEELSDNYPDNNAADSCTSNNNKVASPRYDLRKRKKINYDEQAIEPDVSPNFTGKTFNVSTLLQISLALALLNRVLASSITNESTRSIQCFPGGVRLTSYERIPYEVCAEYYCVQMENPKIQENITFPPDIILHDHNIRWKLTGKYSGDIVETLCPPGPFCDAITCTFCANNILVDAVVGRFIQEVLTDLFNH